MCRNAAKWKFKIDSPVRWNCGRTLDRDWAFEDKKHESGGKRRLEIARNGDITVLPSYAWDGCTPKFCVLDIELGIPDGVVDSRYEREKTYYASLFHDVLYQFLRRNENEFPFKRHEVDRFFLTLMSYTGFRWRYIYFAAVWLIGGVFRRLAELKRRRKGGSVSFGQSHVSVQPYVVTARTEDSRSTVPMETSATS